MSTGARIAVFGGMKLPFLVLGLVVLNCILLSTSLERMREAGSAVRHTLAVQKQLSDVLVMLLNAETGQRGYLVTADPRYLAPYQLAATSIDGLLATLRESISDNPAQVGQVDRLSQLSSSKLEELSTSIGAFSAGNRDQALGMVNADDGRTVMGEIRGVLAQMEATEASLLSERYSAYTLAILATYASAVLFVIGTLVLIGVLYFRVRRQLIERSAAAAEVARYAQSLNESVDALKTERNEISGLYEAGSILQTCNSLGELGELLPVLMRTQFPGSRGEVSVFAESRNQLTTLACWEGWTASELFGPEDCWALRRGQPHRHVTEGHAPRCSHLRVPDDFETVCVPLLAHGETIGLLSLGRPHSAGDPSYLDYGRKVELLARQIGLTLTSLRLRESLKELSIRDPLTGVFNRRYLDSVGAKELAYAARSGRPLGVVMLDVDHFKRFNDMHGHAAGDAALVAVTDFMRRSIRDSDWMFRYGGEEFVLLLCDPEPQDIEMRLDELRTGIEALSVTHNGRRLPGVTISMGVTLAARGERDLTSVLADADAALYAAKAGGRNRVVFAHQPRAEGPQLSLVEA